MLVSDDFCESGFQRGVQSFRRFLVFWSKNRLFKKGMVAIPFFSFFVLVVVGGCYYEILKKGLAKTTL